MELPTYATLSAKVKSELDLYEETFITDTELLGYFNEGIDTVEGLIHTIYEDYFLCKTTLSIVSGTQDYALPSGIYAQKIRRLIYSDSTTSGYDIRQIKNLSDIPYSQTEDALRYLLTNEAATGPRISFYPTPNFTSSSYVTLFYIRNATKFTGVTTETCDIPEWSHVVVQYVKWRCMEKEGHPNVGEAAQALDQLKSLMVETLSNRVIDEDTKLQNDMSFYKDFDNFTMGGGY